MKKEFLKKPLKAVLFDMDGVLFDSMPYHADAWHEVMKMHGMNLEKEEAYMHEGRTGRETINLISKRQKGRAATDAEMNAIYESKCKLFNANPPAPEMPGAMNLLSALKQSGIKIVLVTGSGQHSLFDRLEIHYPGIFSKDKMVTAYDVKNGKPNPEPYLKGLEKAGVLADEAIVVENAPLGVESAHAASIFTVAVNTGPLNPQVLVDSGANLVFPSLNKLVEVWTK